MNMNKVEAQLIFSKHNLGPIESFDKIEIGFTNKVYSINNQYILKVCEDTENEDKFLREEFFYNYFNGQLPVPKIITFDDTKKIYNKFYVIYHKIKGDNLYSKWHLMNNAERKEIVRQLCGFLKLINQTTVDSFVKKFNLPPTINWRGKMVLQINESLEKVEERKLLSSNFVQHIREFVNKNQHFLDEQKIALVYWDTHFDNILVNDNKIVGILDFERTELASIDFVLDIVNKMMEFPKKYMSEAFEQYAKKEDYAQLSSWFKEFYPELFAFKDLEKRFAMYALENDLRILLDWPNSEELKGVIAKTVGYIK